MRSRHFTGVLFCVAAVAWSAAAQGAIVAQYSFADVVPSTLNRDATTVAANATAGAITDAPAYPPTAPTHNMVVLARSVDQGYPDEPFLAASRGAWDEANDIANVYFSIDVAPASGYELDLSTLTFNVARGGSAGPRTYDVRSSADGFAASLVAGPVEIPTQRPTWTPVSVDLSDAAFQNLTSPLTFQIHYMGLPGQFGQNIDFDDITVNGTVSATSPGIVGDYNSDLKVDAADYTVWRDTLGSTEDLRANGDATGASATVIDQADYIAWKSNYGNSGTGAGQLAASAVPEPSSVALIALVAAGWGAFAKRR